MRKFLLALGLLLALAALLSSPAESSAPWTGAARQGQMAVGVTGGLTQPIGQLGDDVRLDAHIGDSGLNLAAGLNGGGYADYFLTHRFALGVFAQGGELHMNDLKVNTGSGTRTFEKLVTGRTTMLGLYGKYYFRPRGSWSSYSYLGAAHVDRKANLSRDILELYPGATVFEMRDDRVGWVAGLGSEYAWNDRLSLGLVASLDYSGELDHDFQWMGHQTVVHDWSFVTLHATMSWHLGVGQ
ncbi:MAG: outer membrane beta-barrel protein [Candidatus Eisenbacteria bacterium]